MLKQDYKEQKTEILFEISKNESDQYNVARPCFENMNNQDSFQMYREMVGSNNFHFMYDKTVNEYCYQRTDPVYDGLIIMDVISAKIICVDDEDFQEHSLKPDNYGTSYQLHAKKREFFGPFGKPCLSDFAARYIAFMNKNQHSIDSKYKQLIVCQSFINVARCEEDILFFYLY